MRYVAIKQHVGNRGVPPDGFLDELVEWGRSAPDDIFAPGPDKDIYGSVSAVLGPWHGPLHRRAAMLEVMRVLAGLESSWNWDEGPDANTKYPTLPATLEAGAWQVSADSMSHGKELTNLVFAKVGSLDAEAFQREMKRNHFLAMEYIARLLRRTINHNGPVKSHEIDLWLKKEALTEFVGLLNQEK